MPRVMRTDSSLVSRFVAYIWPSARARSSSPVGSVVGVYGPPDAPVDLDRGAVDAERPAECIPQPADERAGPIVAPRAHREHHELVAADAGDGVRLAHDCLESAGERSQHGVAGTVTADVVDVLEAVEVDHDERERLARAA